MTEVHINKNELVVKIKALMEYRLFPSLLEVARCSDDEKKELDSLLIELQYAIYLLDAHLEANWQIDPKVLKYHWENISEKLMAFGVRSDDVSSYLTHIKKYEKHELELRSYKSPLRFDMEYFYFYKSCDVKLLRRLIYERLSLSRLCGTLADWRYFDLITEVNDDVNDLFEDLEFINGNRFLLSLITYGKQRTLEDFTAFLEQIKSKAEIKYKSQNSLFSDIILQHTKVQIDETQMLINNILSELSMTSFYESKLLFYSKQEQIS